jgi:HAD superfamily hydrolase (TIGR01509 family)
VASTSERLRTLAVIFDLDGLLVESEGVWNAAKRELVESCGGRWREDAPRTMMGMSSTEWSGYLHDQLGVPLPPQQISAIVVDRLRDLYAERLPLLPGARGAVVRLADVWPLGLASSSNRPIIELVLDLAELRDAFTAIVSSEEVGRGKPAPDVYLEVARRLDVPPARCVAVEDSSNGIRSGVAAGMTVLAVPNREYPPEDEALSLAAGVLGSLEELTVQRVAGAVRGV